MEFWQYILSSLKADKAVYFLYVIKSEGSSPGKTAFKMAIADNGSFIGTIGGGIMEFKIGRKSPYPAGTENIYYLPARTIPR